MAKRRNSGIVAGPGVRGQRCVDAALAWGWPEQFVTKRKPTVAMPLLNRIITFAETLGVARADFVKQLGLEPDALADFDSRVAHTVVDRAWALGAALTRDDAFGLHLGERSPLGTFDLFDLRFANSETVHDAIRQLARYQRLIGEGAQMRVAIEGDLARLALHEIDPAEYTQRHEMECLFALGLGRVRWVTRRPIEVVEVAFRHGPPKDTSEHRRFFRAPIVFGAARNEIVVPVETLRLPTIGATPAVAAVIDRYATRLLGELPELQLDVSERTQQVIREILKGVRPTIASVARRMGMSGRTLQRSLGREGTEFQVLLEQVQFEAAKKLLTIASSSTDEIAFLLGFSDRTTFHRAFRRWSGTTPGEFRKEAIRP